MEKDAVRIGGGSNHRFGLFDGILIKDNHIKAAGGIRKAVTLAKKAHHLSKIEIEVQTVQGLSEAIEVGADIVMLDNMCYEGGIVEFVAHINKNRQALHDPPIYVRGEREGMTGEIALQYNDSYQETVFSFANSINTVEGGTDLPGFRAALTRTLNFYLQSESSRLPKELRETQLSGDDVREGLAAVVAVKVPSPQFEGQTKTKLGNSEVKGLVESLVNEKLNKFFEENPTFARKIVAKGAEAARARDAARRARDLARSKGSLLDGTQCLAVIR